MKYIEINGNKIYYFTDISFAISHVLRELGFHKESSFYCVKPKGQEPVAFQMNYDNCWKIKHHDWNKDAIFKPSYGEPWSFYDSIHYPYYQKFDEEGYICTLPSNDQINSFCERNGFPLECSLTDNNAILLHLIKVYRKKAKQPRAFEKYIPLTKREEPRE